MSVLSARKAFSSTTGIRVRSDTATWICLWIFPELECKDRVVQFFRSRMSQDLSAELCEKLAMAMDELLGNAIEHGCKVEPKTGVELTYIKTNRSIMIQLRDAGPGFKLTGITHAAVNNPPDEPLRHAEFRSQMGLRPGGFGIMLVQQIADELIYNESGNEVMLIKYL